MVHRPPPELLVWQVLSVTDPTSDLTLEYKTKFVSQNDVANYAAIRNLGRLDFRRVRV